MDRLLNKNSSLNNCNSLWNDLLSDPALTRFKTNSLGFWNSYRLYFTIFIIALLCDTASTMYFMTKLGTHAELHPLIRLFSEMAGPIMGPVLGAVGKTWACIAVTLYLRKYAVHILVSASAIYVWAAWYNITGVYFYYCSNTTLAGF